jgi:DNA integrity scanning protein DisA with diadenylate cyclase activity
MPLSDSEYITILKSHLVPMFPGTRLSALAVSAPSASTLVAKETPVSLLIWPAAQWPTSFRLSRPSHPFDDGDVRIIKHFVVSLREKLVAADRPFFHYLLGRCQQDTVACSIQHRLVGDDLLPWILSVLQKWASETYEGHRIAVTIGVDPRPAADRISNVHISDVIQQDLAKVISNGLDTLLILSPSGHIVEHARLTTASDEGGLSPRRYLPIAEWAADGRVAFVLNRNGEILVFKHSQLLFAYRRGTWAHFSHSAMVARIAARFNRKLVDAVYTTCVDVSFSRTGGCICLVKKKSSNRYRNYVALQDIIATSTTKKAALFAHVAGKPFHEIPRAIREEIAAIDGAVVIGHDGKLLAAGAIVRVQGGSDGGGRRAAAKALSRLGLAVKVSADGGITAFTDKGSLNQPEVAFEVCV